MANESSIAEFLEEIRTALYGETVRGAIWKSIDQCYKDVHNVQLTENGFRNVLTAMMNEGIVLQALRDELGFLTETTRNLFDLTTAEKGVLGNNGIITVTTGFVVSAFIPVSNETTYRFVNTYNRAFYNSSKAFQSMINTTTWTANMDGYIRVSVSTNNRGTAAIYVGTDPQDYIRGRSAADYTLRENTYTKAQIDAGFVPLPDESDLGQNGQILRSTGDGTEWVLPSTPTPQQVATALSAWLAEHPEAVTTVVDNSLTAAKLKADSVTTEKIVDEAVTDDKLATDSVTTEKILDGAITETKIGADLMTLIAKDYITPQMFDAVADGVTDDTGAFQSAIAAAVTGKKKLVIPAGNYHLVDPVWVDDSILIYDQGTYASPGYHPIISKNLRESAPVTRYIEYINSYTGTGNVMANINKAYRLQGACAISSNAVVLAFCTAYNTDEYVGDDPEDQTTDLILVKYNVNFTPTANNKKIFQYAASAVITNGGHGNAMCFDGNYIYTVRGNGPMGTGAGELTQIIKLNTSLTVVDQISINSGAITPDKRIWNIAYDSTNKIFYLQCSRKVNGVSHSFLRAYDSDWNDLEQEVDISVNVADEAINMHNGGATDNCSIVAQAAIVYKEQLLEVFYSSRSGATAGWASDGCFIAQYNYSTGLPKKVYRLSSPVAQYEPQCLINMGGRLYLFTDGGLVNGNNPLWPIIHVEQVIFDERMAGQSDSLLGDPVLLGTVDYQRNFNSILGPGTYISGGNTTSASMTNSPWTNRDTASPSDQHSGFTLFVVPVGSKNRLLQVIVADKGEIFTRVGNISSPTGGTPQVVWTGWVQQAESIRLNETRAGGWIGTGYITNSKQQLNFLVPFYTPRNTIARLPIRLGELRVKVRQEGNYITGSNDWVTLVNSNGTSVSPYTVEVTQNSWGLRFTVNRSSEFPESLNNYPAIIEINNLQVTGYNPADS